MGNLGYNTVINQSKCATDKPTTLLGLNRFKITTARGKHKKSKDTVLESDHFPLRQSPLLFDNNLCNNSIVDRVSFVFTGSITDTTQHYSNLWNSLIFIRATYADLFKVLLFSQEFEQLVKTNYMLGNPCQLRNYKLIAWLFGRLVIKWPLTLGRFVEFPRAIPQTSLGIRGHLITNLPQAMLLLINIAFLPTPAKYECQAPKIWVPCDQPVSGSSP